MKDRVVVCYRPGSFQLHRTALSMCVGLDVCLQTPRLFWVETDIRTYFVNQSWHRVRRSFSSFP